MNDSQEIQRKNSPEIQSFLKIVPNIITIDGPDGTGKTTLSDFVYRFLAEKFGKDHVVLLEATNVRGSPSQERLRRLQKTVKSSWRRENQLYSAGVNRAYGDIVIPAIAKGQLVVIDRSEVDILRYAIQSKDETVIADRIRYLKSGILTRGYLAKNRVYVTSTREDIWANLNNRPNRSPYDPQTLEDVNQQLTSQETAEAYIQEISKDSLNVIMVNNQRQSINPRGYLKGIAESIVENLLLPGNFNNL